MMRTVITITPAARMTSISRSLALPLIRGGLSDQQLFAPAQLRGSEDGRVFDEKLKRIVKRQTSPRTMKTIPSTRKTIEAT
jgi:hypothetical protein